MNERKAHWLRTNAANRLPRRVIVFDCESQNTRGKTHAEHTFRVGVGSCDILDADAIPCRTTEWHVAESTASLWAWIASCTNHSHRTVAFAHNLSFDLRISHALKHLPQLGFTCGGIALNNYSCWARFMRGRHSLILVDSFSFIPTSVERIASAIASNKLPLPEDDASSDEWLARCRSDVETTREAVLRLLRWFRVDDLGDFRTTGAGQGFAAFRHRFLSPGTLLVHNSEDALAAERRAIWTGRAEVWRHGIVGKEVCEYDFASAYAHIAKQTELPCHLLGEHGPLPYSRVQRIAEKYAVVADVEIKTEAPTVPTRHDDHIIWPVGSFQTTLWDNELQLAHENGAKIKVLRFWQYKKLPFLHEWAEWILDLLDGNGAGSDPLLRFTIKDWSRSLIGRFGLRYPEYEDVAITKSADIRMFGCYDSDDHCSRTYLQLGHEWFEQMGLVESPNSMPAVMGYIMASARVQLWRLMEDAGFGTFYYADTDGIIAPYDKGIERLGLNGERYLSPLRHKASYSGGDFRAPRNIDLGDIRRVNGAPRKAERLTRSVYRGEVWESLQTALRRHRPDRVFVSDRTFRISDDDPRRRHLPDGSTEPIRIG